MMEYRYPNRLQRSTHTGLDNLACAVSSVKSYYAKKIASELSVL